MNSILPPVLPEDDMEFVFFSATLTELCIRQLNREMKNILSSFYKLLSNMLGMKLPYLWVREWKCIIIYSCNIVLLSIYVKFWQAFSIETAQISLSALLNQRYSTFTFRTSFRYEKLFCNLAIEEVFLIPGVVVGFSGSGSPPASDWTFKAV